MYVCCVILENVSIVQPSVTDVPGQTTPAVGGMSMDEQCLILRRFLDKNKISDKLVQKTVFGQRTVKPQPTELQSGTIILSDDDSSDDSDIMFVSSLEKFKRISTYYKNPICVYTCIANI